MLKINTDLVQAGTMTDRGKNLASNNPVMETNVESIIALQDGDLSISASLIDVYPTLRRFLHKQH